MNGTTRHSWLIWSWRCNGQAFLAYRIGRGTHGRSPSLSWASAEGASKYHLFPDIVDRGGARPMAVLQRDHAYENRRRNRRSTAGGRILAQLGASPTANSTNARRRSGGSLGAASRNVRF